MAVAEEQGRDEEQAFLTLNKWIPIKTTHQSFVVIDNPSNPYKGNPQDGLSFYNIYSFHFFKYVRLFEKISN